MGIPVAIDAASFSLSLQYKFRAKNTRPRFLGLEVTGLLEISQILKHIWNVILDTLICLGVHTVTCEIWAFFILPI